jgi:hypothetical protein
MLLGLRKDYLLAADLVDQFVAFLQLQRSADGPWDRRLRFTA